MALSVGAPLQYRYLRCPFPGEVSGLHISRVSTAEVVGETKFVKFRESRIGKQPITVPSNVTLTMDGRHVKVQGPLGELALTYPEEVELEKEDGGILKVKRTSETKRANQMHGLYRTLIDNMVVGVSKGFEKRLLMIGTGYRAAIEGNDLVLFVGFSHPVRLPIPDDLQVKVEENTTIIVSGYEKSHIGHFAAKIRYRRPPEPYKGKGIRYANEIVRRKAGKAGKKK